MSTQHHRLLLDCYLSGQVSAEQWASHLKNDPELVDFVASEMGVAKPVTVAEVTAAQNGDPAPDLTFGVRARAFEAYLLTTEGRAIFLRYRDYIGISGIAKDAFKAGWNAHKQSERPLHSSAYEPLTPFKPGR